MRKWIAGVLLGLLLNSGSVLGIDVIQNVARSFVIEAPALDKTDGVTPETALTMTSFVINAYKKNKAPLTITAALAVFASSTLTSDATAPSNNDTVTFTGTLDGTLITELYTYKTTLTGAANEVLIQGTAALALDNLKCAINDTGCSGEGTSYGTGTVASVLVNATTNTDTTQLVVANVPGTLGNSYTTAEGSTHLSWTGSTLASGVDGMIHDANGYHWFCAPATTWDTLGDMLLTFNYAAEAAPFFQKVRVVANRSNEIGVQGLGTSTDELLETNLNTVGSSSAWAYKLNQLDIATSAIWNELIANHTTADSFGARVARTGVDSRPIDVSAGGAVSPDWANVEAPTTTLALTGTTISTGQVVASVSGAVGSVGAAVTLPSIPSNWITAAGINADAFTAAKFHADVSTEFATTLMATTYEGSETFKHFLQYGASALFGKYNSAAGTFNFRDLADTKNRIVYVTTATTRSSVTLSPD